METRLYNALQLSAYVLRRGKILLVFPEGSRSRDGSIKEFKKGVGIISKELNIPIVPVAISGTYAMLPSGRLFPKPSKITVSFGKPVHPSGRDYDEIVKTLYGDVVKMLEGQKSKHEVRTGRKTASCGERLTCPWLSRGLSMMNKMKTILE